MHDGFTDLETISILYHIVWYCNQHNLTLKLHQKKSYLYEVRFIIGRFKVGSSRRMINKEELAQFTYKTI